MERNTTAGIVIEDGKVLVGRRVKGGSLSEKWEFPGGKNRYGETLSDTLRREFEEELAVSIETGNEIFSYDFSNNGTDYHLHAMLVKLLSHDFRLSVHEEMRWVDRAELSALDMGGSDSAIRTFILTSGILRQSSAQSPSKSCN